MIGAANVKAGLTLLAVGLGGGLVMSLYAFQPMVRVPAGLARYDDLPRRLFRLAHMNCSSRMFVRVPRILP